MAEVEVAGLLSALHPALRAQAAAIPVAYEDRPSADLIEDGIEPDTLGLFVGLAYPDSASERQDLPSRIFLFLQNIWENVDGDVLEFRREVRTTYLHELGHYLGLDEQDLVERDLE
jgi:predicted Zn-dependent protease with MMP-like domain